MTFGEWLQNQLDRHEWSQSDFSRATGLSTTTISKYIIGPEKPSRLATIQSIANALRLSVEDVQAAIRGEDGKPRRSPEDILAELEANQPVAVPVIRDLVAHMGSGGGFIDDYVFLPPSYRQRRRGNLRAVLARGDCMEPKIADGDVVVFDKEASWKPNDLVIAAVDGHAAVRRFVEVRGKPMLKQDADGALHAMSDGDQIFGRVVYIMRPLLPMDESA